MGGKKKKEDDDKLGRCGRYKNKQEENKRICNYGDNPRQKMQGCVAT